MGYLLIVRDILPQIATSLKYRKKKVSGGAITSVDQEGDKINIQTAETLEGSLKNSKDLLNKINSESSAWLETTLKSMNKNTFVGANELYIKTLGELKGRSSLIQEVIKKN